MKHIGRMFALFLTLIVPIQYSHARELNWIVGTEGNAPLDFYIQIPHESWGVSYIWHMQDHNIGLADPTQDSLAGLSIKFHQQPNDLFESYILLDSSSHYSNTTSYYGDLRATLGYGMEVPLGRYFILDGMLGAVYKSELDKVIPAFTLRAGYRITPATGQQSIPGLEIGTEPQSFSLKHHNVYIQLPFNHGKNAINAYLKRWQKGSDIYGKVGFGLKQYREPVLGMDFYSETEIGMQTNPELLVYGVFSHGFGLEKVFYDHYVVSGKLALAGVGLVRVEPQINLRVGYRF